MHTYTHIYRRTEAHLDNLEQTHRFTLHHVNTSFGNGHGAGRFNPIHHPVERDKAQGNSINQSFFDPIMMTSWSWVSRPVATQCNDHVLYYTSVSLNILRSQVYTYNNALSTQITITIVYREDTINISMQAGHVIRTFRETPNMLGNKPCRSVLWML
jgi:hypothetical protein